MINQNKTKLVTEQYTLHSPSYVTAVVSSRLQVPYSTYYKPMVYYKPTSLFSSKFLYRYRMLIYGRFVYIYKHLLYYKPTPLFIADIREITNGLIIRTYGSCQLTRP